MDRKKITWQETKAQIDQQFTDEEREEMDSKIALANLLISERNKRGWTQEQLASKAGLHQVQIARIESGERMPSFKTLTKIATAFNRRVGFVPMDQSENELVSAPSSAGHYSH